MLKIGAEPIITPEHEEKPAGPPPTYQSSPQDDKGDEKVTIRQPVRRMPFPLREDVDRMAGEILDIGAIQPSRSPWASPVVLVKKKDGGMGGFVLTIVA